MNRTISTLLIAGLSMTLGCKSSTKEAPGMPMDTLKPAGNNSLTKVVPKDTAQPKSDSNTTRSDLPPMAKAMTPDQLSKFLPAMSGWNPSGELQKEIQAHDNFNKSRVAQTYTNGNKKVTVEINDFAYIPYLYESWTKFKGAYLDEDNVSRTETTTINGYHAVQSMEKKDPHGTATVFPGNRYVVTVTEDGTTDINEIRQIIQTMDLKGLENLK